MNTNCGRCYQFKLRWKDGSGVCYHLESPRHADQAACEAFDPKAILRSGGGEIHPAHSTQPVSPSK